MDGRFHLGRIVIQEIEYIIALGIMGADHHGSDRDVIEHQRVRNHAFAHPKVACGVLGLERLNRDGKLLAVAAGVVLPINVIGMKQGHGGQGVDDGGTAGAQRLQAQVIARGPDEGAGRDIRHLAQPVEAQVGAPADQAGGQNPVVTLVMGGTTEDMLERLHEATVGVHGSQHLTQGDLRYAFIELVVGNLAGWWGGERPGAGRAMLCDLNGVILTRCNPAIDAAKLGFQLVFKRSEVLCNGHLEDGEVGSGDQGIFVRPPFSERDQITFQAPKANTVGTDQVARLERGPHLEVDERLVAVEQQLGCPSTGLDIEVAFEPNGDAVGRDRLGLGFGQRPFIHDHRLEKLDGRE